MKKLKLHLKKGALHKDLGVSPDKPIPTDKLEKAAHSSDPLEKKRAVFAQNAAGWNKGGKTRKVTHAKARKGTPVYMAD